MRFIFGVSKRIVKFWVRSQKGVDGTLGQPACLAYENDRDCLLRSWQRTSASIYTMTSRLMEFLAAYVSEWLTNLMNWYRAAKSVFSLSQTTMLGPRVAVENADDVRIPHGARISQRVDLSQPEICQQPINIRFQLDAENLSQLVAALPHIFGCIIQSVAELFMRLFRQRARF